MAYTRQDLTFIESCVVMDEKWADARTVKDEDPDYYAKVKAEYIAHRNYWRGIREALGAGLGPEGSN